MPRLRGQTKGSQATRSTKLMRILRIVKVTRLLRLLRAAKIGRMLRKYEVRARGGNRERAPPLVCLAPPSPPVHRSQRTGSQARPRTHPSRQRAICLCKSQFHSPSRTFSSGRAPAPPTALRSVPARAPRDDRPATSIHNARARASGRAPLLRSGADGGEARAHHVHQVLEHDAARRALARLLLDHDPAVPGLPRGLVGVPVRPPLRLRRGGRRRGRRGRRRRRLRRGPAPHEL